jgi:pimeloyl-ACP methyl ester carboxylesterase
MRKLFFLFCFTAIFAGVFLMTRAPFPDTEARPADGQQNTMALGDQMITYYAQGSGPRIVLMASAGREASDFNELIADLVDAGYRTVAIEAPGINGTSILTDPSLYSFATHIEAVIINDTKAKGEGPAFVIGHAFGNRVVRTAAQQYPELIQGVILIAAGGQKPIEPTAEAALKNIFNPISSFKKRKKDMAYAFFADGNEIPKYWQRGWHTKTAVLQGKSKTETPDTDWQAGGNGPMLVVQADADRIAPKADTADILLATYPDRVSVVLIDNASHALLPEQPEAVSKAVLDFLTTHHPIGSYE